MSRRSPLPASIRAQSCNLIAAAAAAAALCLSAGHAHARAGGIASAGCSGCHGGGPKGMLTLTPSSATINPNDRVEFTLTIAGSFKDGGTYVSTAAVGDLQVISNQGLSEVSSGLVHNQPKSAGDGGVQFRFAWVAPADPGAVRFSIYAIGGNGDLRSSGDTPLEQTFDFTYGCMGQTFYLDGDADGVGRADFSMLGCKDKPPQGYVTTTGDCDDYRKTVHPGAPELCNMIDDNCDGQIDENAVPVELWPDADGDGYYDARTEKVGMPKIGCVGIKGWAAEPGDCQPMNKAVNPGAEEVCNNIDDDCDGDVDERVRPTCGEGWCRREAPGCDLAYCMPGEPTKEKCNFLDDDCDGLTDEDPDMCPAGQTCAAGTCLDSGQVVIDQNGMPQPIAGSSGTAATGGGSGSSGGNGATPPSSFGGSSGCAFGSGASHGALAALLLLTASAALRRRRR